VSGHPFASRPTFLVAAHVQTWAATGKARREAPSSVNSDTLSTLTGEAGSDDPIVALKAINRMRVELDRVEALAVRRARNANASWQLVEIALGVNRQAVHKKYGRREERAT
jgi:hypothetical protein